MPQDDMLDAALALLEAIETEEALRSLCVSSDAGLGRLNDAELASNECKSRRSAQSKKSSSTRQKEEIARLRGEITELSRVQLRLKSRHGRRFAPSSANFELVSMWAAIARRQRRFREKAEAENAKLRARIEGQFSAGQDVASLLTATIGEQTPCLEFSADLESSETRARLDHLYDGRHVAFSTACFADTTTSFRDRQIVERSENQTTIASRDGWVTPFPARQLDQAFWNILCRRSVWEDAESIMEHKCTDDTVFITYRAIATSEQVTLGTLQSKMAIRRYRSDTDSLSDYVMWYVAEPAPVDSTPDELRNLFGCEAVWYRVRESKVGSSGSLRSQFQTSARACIDCTAIPSTYRQETMEIIIKFALQEIKRDFEWTQEALEHELVILSNSMGGIDDNSLLMHGADQECEASKSKTHRI
ncbi:hypothetical protein Poli38472_000978 [Pythium oligandrum]|uniref:START domain-containing protein n=1 Tax=Pythium oligandrum TaxID=41045 RepID=A0A8K1CCQ3_PYTOL|nr:hypothetical protein Poli38472_000978 [Pythium oligandrum]|eukprot:TMW60936.1 hypothetical protein Poli38472_000978 [Pythium oligandrum]